MYTEHPLSRSCPFLDTINRSILDFDFEKLCSVSLSNHNVYACLVCGKYFQGTLAVAKKNRIILCTCMFTLTIPANST